MPTYDYKCEACGHLFEHFQSISDARLKKCPKCGKPKLERLIGAGGGLLFKGSGFYITDYRNRAYHDAAKKDAAPAASGDGKAATSGGPDAKSSDSKSPESKASDAKSHAPKEGGAKSPAPAAPKAASPAPAAHTGSSGSKKKGR